MYFTLSNLGKVKGARKNLYLNNLHVLVCVAIYFHYLGSLSRNLSFTKKSFTAE